jgi:hypothetical protein
MVAGLIILATGWVYADPLVSVFIALLILVSSFGALRDTVLVLLEAAPRGTDPKEIGDSMASFPASSTCTTCTCGRSPSASRRSPRMYSSGRATTAIASVANWSGYSTSASGSTT